MKKSELEEELEFQFKSSGLSFIKQLKFHPTRRFRFDFAFPDDMLAVEVNGGTWINGGHSRGSGIERDYEKIGEAMKLGWSVYQCTGNMVKNGQALDTILKILENRNC